MCARSLQKYQKTNITEVSARVSLLENMGKCSRTSNSRACESPNSSASYFCLILFHPSLPALCPWKLTFADHISRVLAFWLLGWVWPMETPAGNERVKIQRGRDFLSLCFFHVLAWLFILQSELQAGSLSSKVPRSLCTQVA